MAAGDEGESEFIVTRSPEMREAEERAMQAALDAARADLPADGVIRLQQPAEAPAAISPNLQTALGTTRLVPDGRGGWQEQAITYQVVAHVPEPEAKPDLWQSVGNFFRPVGEFLRPVTEPVGQVGGALFDNIVDDGELNFDAGLSTEVTFEFEKDRVGVTFRR